MPVIVSTIRSTNGSADEVERLIADAMPAIHAMKGCEVYALHRVRGQQHAGEFILIEKWTEDSDLQRYGASPELVALHDQLEPLIHSLTDYLVVDATMHGDPSRGAL